MLLINIDKLVSFAPNVGVLVHREALDSSPDRLFEAVRVAYSHMNDKSLLDACCGASGPLANYGELSYEEYLQLLERIRIEDAAHAAKQVHTKARRADFNSKRSQLVLAMIEAGISYVCSIPGCNATEELTVDHIVPLSRGGRDDLSNLRFLCRRHNSSKSDKLDA